MKNHRWMLYGATGFTGRLIADEAVRRGHRPLLAGRSAERLAPLAERLGLEWIALDLRNRDLLTAALQDLELVMHAAGPFVETAPPMVQAAIDAGTHYLDISGEIPVLRHTLACDNDARARHIAIISGCGFDVVPTDCLAARVASQIENADTLDIAIHTGTRPTHGTVLSSLALVPKGGWIREGGVMRSFALGRGSWRVRFPFGTRTVLPLPVGDLETAWRTTAIGNIRTGLTVPRFAPAVVRLVAPALRLALASEIMMRLIRRMVGRLASGPDERHRDTAHAYAHVTVANAAGATATASIETVEPYRFTAMSAVRAVERVLADHPVGALTPAQAFGMDFMMEIAGTRVMVSA